MSATQVYHLFCPISEDSLCSIWASRD
jgi:hypothetical protein